MPSIGVYVNVYLNELAIEVLFLVGFHMV